MKAFCTVCGSSLFGNVWPEGDQIGDPARRARRRSGHPAVSSTPSSPRRRPGRSCRTTACRATTRPRPSAGPGRRHAWTPTPSASSRVPLRLQRAATGAAARGVGRGRRARRAGGPADRRREVGDLRARRAAAARADGRRLAADRAAGRPGRASPRRRPRRRSCSTRTSPRASTRPRWRRPRSRTRSCSSRRSSSPTGRRARRCGARGRGCSPSTRRT